MFVNSRLVRKTLFGNPEEGNLNDSQSELIRQIASSYFSRVALFRSLYVLNYFNINGFQIERGSYRRRLISGKGSNLF